MVEARALHQWASREDRCLAARSLEEGSVLDRHLRPTDNDAGARVVIKVLDQRCIVEDTSLIDPRHVREHRGRSGCQDEVLGRKDLPLDFDGMRIDDTRGGIEDVLHSELLLALPIHEGVRGIPARDEELHHVKDGCLGLVELRVPEASR